MPNDTSMLVTQCLSRRVVSYRFKQLPELRGRVVQCSSEEHKLARAVCRPTMLPVMNRGLIQPEPLTENFLRETALRTKHRVEHSRFSLADRTTPAALPIYYAIFAYPHIDSIYIVSCLKHNTFRK